MFCLRKTVDVMKRWNVWVLCLWFMAMMVWPSPEAEEVHGCGYDVVNDLKQVYESERDSSGTVGFGEGVCL